MIDSAKAERIELASQSLESAKIRPLRPKQQPSIELFAGIAHDMRAPLATIATSAELLESDLIAEDSAHLVSVIQRQTFRLQQMVQDLADCFNHPAGVFKIYREVVDLAQLTQEVCSEFQQFERSHRLIFERPATEVLAPLDSEKVRRILQNLLSNAVLYSPRGGAIFSRLRLPPDHPREAIIEVEDEGPGVPESLREEIFQPFVRLEAATTKGQGLGLYIVRCLAEAHAGRSWVETATSGGARFCVALPLFQEERASKAKVLST